jgi:hypothetical protein
MTRKPLTATLAVNLAKGIFETVEIVRFGGGILSENVRVRRPGGHTVWVPKHQLIWR